MHLTSSSPIILLRSLCSLPIHSHRLRLTEEILLPHRYCKPDSLISIIRFDSCRLSPSILTEIQNLLTSIPQM